MKPVPEFAADFQHLETLRSYDFMPTSVLDIGASNGVWSGTCSLVYPDAEYFLIEPQKYPVEYAPVPNYRRHFIHQPVGPREEEVNLIVPENRHAKFNAHVLAPPVGSDSWHPIREKLPMRQTTVDRLLETGVIRPPQLVKIDVQGYELEVLLGATKLWDSARVFFVETSLYRYWDKAPLLSEVVAFFAGRGFQVYDFSTECRMPGKLLAQIDIIFVSAKCQLFRLMDEVSKPTWTA